MTQEEKHARWSQIYEEYRSGVGYPALAEKYGLTLSYVYLITKWMSGELPRPLTRAEQAKNRADAEKKWAEWKAKHIRTCEDVPGECCAECHAAHDYKMSKQNRLTYYLCCTRRVPSQA